MYGRALPAVSEAGLRHRPSRRAQIATGSVGFAEGFFTSNADAVNITVRGIGGHGSRPEITKDPIVLASQIVLALQTIVSREIHPGERAVVTVGSIHGGTRGNIIPDEVKLELTLRSYSQDVREHLVASIRRICRGEAIAAGIPEDLMPTVEVVGSSADSIYNDPALTRRVRTAVTGWLGSGHVVSADPIMASEDFSQYGRTVERVPVCFFMLGASDPTGSRRAGARACPCHPFTRASSLPCRSPR